MKYRYIILSFAIMAFSVVSTMLFYSKWTAAKQPSFQPSGLRVRYIGFTGGNDVTIPDFVEAAAASMPAVVHIKAHIVNRNVGNHLLQNEDWQINPFEKQASGSGVILSDDGYIVTNNHLIKNADQIKVILMNHQTYKASLVGADPSTDLAVLKIDARHLPILLYGNSSGVKIGQWVLAIGYPWNLDLTVTAGIVSAKASALHLNRSNHAIESFIQTDAVVNLGNSGGALINTKGELIGINSSLASPTGVYTGYSFAIPVNIVKKVVDDLIRYGKLKPSTAEELLKMKE